MPPENNSCDSSKQIDTISCSLWELRCKQKLFSILFVSEIHVCKIYSQVRSIVAKFTCFEFVNKWKVVFSGISDFTEKFK